VRVRLSAFGANALVVGAAHIALSAGGAAIIQASDQTLTFGGQPSITIPPGALVLSDPVNLDVPPLSNLAVSVFVPGQTGPAAWHFEAPNSIRLPSGRFHRQRLDASRLDDTTDAVMVLALQRGGNKLP
jgi:hypothetical protein